MSKSKINKAVESAASAATFLRRSTRLAVVKEAEPSVKVEKSHAVEKESVLQPKKRKNESKKRDAKKKIKSDNLEASKKEKNENIPARTTASAASIHDKASTSPVKNVGAHVSVAGGLHNAITNALEIGAKAFGLFLRNQRQWNAKPLGDEEADLFKKACEDSDFSPNVILPHGIYLMNCASPNEETLAKSRAALIDELKRCEKLGLALYNFHPGSTCGAISKEEGIKKIAESINNAHRETKYVVTVIENMCCQGHTIGGKFEELKSIIDQVDNKSRIGVCFDTCHAFAAGYDIASKEALNHTMELFDEIIGLKYLKAVHLNDSKGECECHLDRHENIGHGKIGVRGFKALMNDPRFNNIPMILETPETDYSREINKLYSFVGKR